MPHAHCAVDGSDWTFVLDGTTVRVEELTEDFEAMAVLSGTPLGRVPGLIAGLQEAVDRGDLDQERFADVAARAARRGRTKDIVASTDSAFLVTLSRDEVWATRKAVAQNPNCPQPILRRLLTDPKVNVRKAVLRNSGLDGIDPDIEAMNASETADLMSGTANQELLERAVKDRRKGVRRAAASNPRCPTELLRRLAQDSVVNVREAVAQNPSAPGDVLTNLAWDSETTVARLAARNSSTPVDVLVSLVRSGDDQQRALAARNPAMRSDLLADLANVPDIAIQRVVAFSPQCPRSTLTQLSVSPDAGVRVAVSQHPNTAPDVLVKLAGDESEHVRTRVAAHLRTPRSVVEGLSNDPVGHVAVNAARALA